MRIKELRGRGKLSQQQLADTVGVCRAAIAKWEAGAAYPSADKLPAIADALGCTIDELYGRAPGAAPPDQAAS